ncbi:hypothetical protein ACWCQN_34970 [Streptomyces sp. NPDC001984]
MVEEANGILMLCRRLVRDHEHRPAAESRVYWAISDVLARRLAGPAPPPLGAAHDQPGLTLGAVLVRLEGRGCDIAAQVEEARE